MGHAHACAPFSVRRSHLGLSQEYRELQLTIVYANQDVNVHHWHVLHILRHPQLLKLSKWGGPPTLWKAAP